MAKVQLFKKNSVEYSSIMCNVGKYGRRGKGGPFIYRHNKVKVMIDSTLYDFIDSFYFGLLKGNC